MKNLIALTLLLGGSTLLCAQKPAKTPATYKPVKSEMYRKGWIDFNKNGVKDVYEDPSAPLEARWTKRPAKWSPSTATNAY